jgi:hypothetical protein
MTPQEVIHIKAAKYANTCKEQFLQKVKEGVIEPRTKKMEGWIWMAQYEGYRDALQDLLKESKQEPVAWMDKQVTPETESVRLTAFKEVAEAWGFSIPLYTRSVLDAALLAPKPGQLKDRGKE